MGWRTVGVYSNIRLFGGCGKKQWLNLAIFTGVLGAIFLIMLNLILSKTIIHPITYLRDAMQRIQAGDLGGNNRSMTDSM